MDGTLPRPRAAGYPYSEGISTHSAMYTRNCGPGRMQLSTNNSRTTLGDQPNLAARPAHTPPMTRERGRTSGALLMVSTVARTGPRATAGGQGPSRQLGGSVGRGGGDAGAT